MIRTKEMQKIVDEFTNKVFGHTMNESVCVTCGNDKIKKEDFKDIISWNEFQISHMCQICQDSVFEYEEDNEL